MSMQKGVCAFVIIIFVCFCLASGFTCKGDDGDASDTDDAIPDVGYVFPPGPQGRQTLSLNGIWEVEQGRLGETPPDRFNHTVQVPALLTAAEPAFAELGVSSNLREAFWYKTTFEIPQQREAAILKIHKAKYGASVWLNGIKLGDHLGSYTLASFNAGDALRTDEPNTLLVRVGDTLESVPNWVPAGQDVEKLFWFPGIYDDVELVLSGSPRIVRVKVEPDIENNAAIIITTLRNDHAGPRTVCVSSQVFEWLEDSTASEAEIASIDLESGQEADVIQTVYIEDAHLWSPEDPFLYVLHSTILREDFVLDELETRFGMRKVQWRSGAEKGFYLNDQPYFLRGSNITIHRFFDDPLAGTLPWDREWVRRLLSTYPKEFHWNAFRVCVGRAPNLWYDLADELGFLLADEFMFWSLPDAYNWFWSVEELKTEYTEWIRESWNHPSIAWWDASNETIDPKSYIVIDLVRHLDQTRQWENGGYGPPHDPDDPIEDHPYFFGNADFDLRELDRNNGHAPQGLGTFQAPNHPYILNEYGWLWINRDGSPTFLSQNAYETLLGPGYHDPEIYRETYAYIVAGLTEFWRSKRGYAGVLHFTYLGYSHPAGATSDNFIDVENLVLEPHWLQYAKSAFAPLMISIDTWREEYPPDAISIIPIQAINDFPVPQSAVIRLLAVSVEGEILSRSLDRPIALDAYGAGDYRLSIRLPEASRYVLFAELDPDDPSLPVVWSRRKVGYANLGDPCPSPPFDSE